jgi:hypothetical protein
MIDVSTNKPLVVSTDGDTGPYIIVPVQQVDDIRKLLDADRVRYWVDENAISLNGKPELTIINLGRGAQVSHIQRILDNAM